MQRTMSKSKLHRATVTDVDLHYVDNYSPRVVHVNARNEILTIDREVATLLTAAPTIA
jgi:aspartate 1-decarboxylase